MSLNIALVPLPRRIVDEEDMPRPGERQTLLFSATFPKEIQRLAADFLHNYIFLTVGGWVGGGGGGVSKGAAAVLPWVQVTHPPRSERGASRGQAAAGGQQQGRC